MGIAILLFLVFAGIEDAPGFGYLGTYPKAGPVKTYAFPPSGTTFVAAMNAVLNITFLWVPQILFPTFISEMEKPQDFPKSLAVLSGLSAVLFIVPPAVGFRYLGQYATAPAFGSLGVVVYKKASFAFVIVPTLVIGVSNCVPDRSIQSNKSRSSMPTSPPNTYTSTSCVARTTSTATPSSDGASGLPSWQPSGGSASSSRK